MSDIILVSGVASVLGAAADEVSQSDREIALNEALGTSPFSGKIVQIGLNPQLEPPKVYKLGMGVGKGIFSGQIVFVMLNPQPEPPAPLTIGQMNIQSS